MPTVTPLPSSPGLASRAAFARSWASPSETIEPDGQAAAAVTGESTGVTPATPGTAAIACRRPGGTATVTR